MLDRVATLLHKLEAALGQALIRAKVGLPLNKVGLDLGRSLSGPKMSLGRPINTVGWDLGSDATYSHGGAACVARPPPATLVHRPPWRYTNSGRAVAQAPANDV